MKNTSSKIPQSLSEEKQSQTRRPDWLKVRVPAGENYEFLKTLLRTQHLHTVCEEANCPNMAECWGARTATFLILGDICTRHCAFCDVKTGRPGPLDWEEPERVAQSVKALNLKHAVITSVNRDEREDGGAPIFARCIERIREVQPGCSVEVLIPDFKGSQEALKIVMEARPEILGHNVETVPRLFTKVQPQDRYDWAMTTLRNAKLMDAEVLTKSGLMLGLGEEWRKSWLSCAISENAASISSRWDNTCNRTNSAICRLNAIILLKNLSNYVKSAMKSGSAGSKAAPSCAAATMPNNRSGPYREECFDSVEDA